MSISVMLSNAGIAIRARLKSLYLRITFNRTTLAFFIITFLHTFTQSVAYSVLFSQDSSYRLQTSAIIQTANVPTNEFAFLTRGKEVMTLRMCDSVAPSSLLGADESNACVVVFMTGQGADGQSRNGSVPIGFRKREHPAGSNIDLIASASVQSQPLLLSKSAVMASSNVNFTGGVTLVDPSDPANRQVDLSQVCTRVVLYVDQILQQTTRESLALIGSEFWLLLISLFALFHDSMPHLLAGLFFRHLSVGWASYGLWRTGHLEERFRALMGDGSFNINGFGTGGACEGVKMLDGWGEGKMRWQIPALVLNVVVLIVTIVLVIRLCKTHRAFMFSRVGAPPRLLPVYHVYLLVHITLQLSLYLLTTSTTLFLDQLISGPLSRTFKNQNSGTSLTETILRLSLALCISTLLLILPWWIIAWHAVRNERPFFMTFFMFTGVFLIVSWCSMYASKIYRWTWLSWPFFASVSVAGLIVLICVMAFGAFFWRKFGQGHKQYLDVEAVLEKSDFEPEVFTHNVDLDLERSNSTSSFDSTHKDSPMASRSPVATSERTNALERALSTNGTRTYVSPGSRTEGDMHQMETPVKRISAGYTLRSEGPYEGVVVLGQERQHPQSNLPPSMEFRTTRQVFAGLRCLAVNERRLRKTDSRQIVM